ncbi:MAG: ribosome small subunit-dependent GTPase A [Pseudomonadales bacterium]
MTNEDSLENTHWSNSSEQPDLQSLGWNNFFQQQTLDAGDWYPARVIRQDLGRYQLISEQGLLIGILPGKARLTTSKADLPTVGDWILYAEQPHGEEVIIQQLLDRNTKFSRKEAGEKFSEQVVAANIDVVFVVTGLDENFNPKRIERYMLLCQTSGALPVVILNKADLCSDIDDKVDQVKQVAGIAPIHSISALSNDDVAPLREYLGKGVTIAVMGSSGVGKSTLINQLLGYEHFKTGAVRDTDSKGRHTTTHRELCPIPNGGMIIDTPGMRELQVWSDEHHLAETFDDVEDLTRFCKFTDCQHQSEPGCAIQAAITSGDLLEERWQSYQKYLRELEFLAEQQDINARLQKKAQNKKFSKMVRDLPNKRT